MENNKHGVATEIKSLKTPGVGQTQPDTGTQIQSER